MSTKSPSVDESSSTPTRDYFPSLPVLTTQTRAASFPLTLKDLSPSISNNVLANRIMTPTSQLAETAVGVREAAKCIGI